MNCGQKSNQSATLNLAISRIVEFLLVPKSYEKNINKNQRLQELNCPRNFDLLSSGSDQAPQMPSKVGTGVESTLACFSFKTGSFFSVYLFFIAYLFGSFDRFSCLKLEDVGNMWEYEV